MVAKLASLQTPDHIIEIRLNPMIQGLSRAVNNFGKHAELQAKAVDENLKQTQDITASLRALLVLLRTTITERAGDTGGVTSPTGGVPPVVTGHDIRGPDA